MTDSRSSRLFSREGTNGERRRQYNVLQYVIIALVIYVVYVLAIERRMRAIELDFGSKLNIVMNDIEHKVGGVEGRLREEIGKVRKDIGNAKVSKVASVEKQVEEEEGLKVGGGDIKSRVLSKDLIGIEGLLAYDGFEQGDLEPMGNSPLSKCGFRRWRKEFNEDGVSVVHKRDGHPVREGNYSMRSFFSSKDKKFIRPEPGHDHKFRSEIIMSSIPTFTDGFGRSKDKCGKSTCCLENLPFRKDYSLWFSIFAPSDWKIDMPDEDERNDDKDTSLMQFHGVPEGRFIVDENNELVTVLDRMKLKENWRSPPLLLSLSNIKNEKGDIVPAWVIRQVHDPRPISENGLSVTHRRRWTKPAWQASAVDDLGKWVDFSFDVRFSWEDDGVMNLYKNGELVMKHSGPNCFNDQVAPRIHFGLYKWNWHIPDVNDTRHAFEKVVYYDNIKVFKGFKNGQ